ncbi:Zinc finger MYM-type protein 1 [Triplophysa tibetana]|uniref:Zinc finger MYM-type protein 1 n=1 Tax=Triplophysa tibetana TaxID=1572043 RepID=A0A5A9PA56_9TELE|nr:Zinc finger MYM-type protein 1 [Triplophysa tibetana]
MSCRLRRSQQQQQLQQQLCQDQTWKLVSDDSGRREAELVEVASTVVEDLGTVETGPARAKLKEYPLTTFGLQRSYTPPAHSTYLSSGSQNEMIQCCAEEVTASIIKEMKHSKMYAVMADEARDGHVEQLAVCVRYVGYENTVKESFLELTSLKSFDAHSITEAIEEVLKSKGLEDLQCVAQAYDGASVMSGAVRGVEAQFRVKHPEAVYVHCYAHELNLVLCHTCRAVPEAIDFFDTLESVYCFFSVSLVNHQSFSDMQKALGLEKSELVQLSKTRWACQLKSVTAVIANLPALLKSLTELTSTTTAIGLLSKLSRLSNVYMLVMFKALLSTTEGLHKYLQKEDVDLAQATWYKDAVLETLRSMRTEEMAEKFYNQAKEILEANHLSETPAPGGSQKRKQKRLDDYVVESTTGTRAYVSTLDKIRNHIFYPCLDRMLWTRCTDLVYLAGRSEGSGGISIYYLPQLQKDLLPSLGEWPFLLSCRSSGFSSKYLYPVSLVDSHGNGILQSVQWILRLPSLMDY